MLVATRDPMPKPGAHEAPVVRNDGLQGRQAGSATRVARFMTALQLAGSLLAIPVGLASAYSIYRTNFAVETTCQTLRTNIVGVIDKKIDSGTRRVLIGRDVETFEKTCGAVEPETVAAFKKLIAEKTPAPAAAAKDSARKADLRPSLPAKAAPAHAPVAPAPAPASAAMAPAQPAQPVQRDAAVSDARWLAAVRGALVTHAPARPHSAEPVSLAAPAVPPPLPAVAPVPVATLPPPAVRPLPEAAPGAANTPNNSPNNTPMTLSAPVLPPAVGGAPAAAQPVSLSPQSAPAPAPVGSDHPVPPGAIPETTSSAGTGSGWVGHIPFVGQVLAR